MELLRTMYVAPPAWWWAYNEPIVRNWSAMGIAPKEMAIEKKLGVPGEISPRNKL